MSSNMGMGVAKAASSTGLATVDRCSSGGHATIAEPRLRFTGALGLESPQPHRAIHLHDVLEKQAKRMAQSLHDEAGQLLAAVYLKLDEVSGTLPAGHRRRVGELRTMLGEFEGELRRLSHELRPLILEDLGLLPAVDFLRQGVAKRTGLTIELRGSTAGRLPETVETALYRIVHEAFGEIANRASAGRVTVSFMRDAEEIQCLIQVAGIVPGLFVSPDSVPAIVAIRDRVEDLSGRFAVRRGLAQGAELYVSIPLES
jgi:signal transduction histidine kinase